MKAVLAIVTLAIILTFVGGIGWITARVFEADAVRIVFQYLLVAAVGVTFLALGLALVVGLWHLYLYLFTRQKPVSLWASVSRDEK